MCPVECYVKNGFACPTAPHVTIVDTPNFVGGNDSKDDDSDDTTPPPEPQPEDDDTCLPTEDTEADCDSISDHDEKFRCIHLARHNKVRSLHQNTPSMTAKASLDNSAQAWAEEMAANNRFSHQRWADRNGEGENLATAWISQTLTGDDLNAWALERSADAVQKWYDEIKDYSWDSPDDKSAHTGVVGHFTQIVWTDSVELGVGWKVFPDPAKGGTKIFIVSRYSPSGNWRGRNHRSVMPLKVCDDDGVADYGEIEDSIPYDDGSYEDDGSFDDGAYDDSYDGSIPAPEDGEEPEMPPIPVPIEEPGKPENPCPEAPKIIKDDNTIRPKSADSLCASAQANSRGQVRSGTKFVWSDCDSAVMKEFEYDETSKQISALMVSGIKKGKNQKHCWSVNKRELRETARNAEGSLKLKVCNDSDVRQKFVLDGGKIWLDMQFDNGKKYCVTFEGEGFIKLRRCFESLA